MREMASARCRPSSTTTACASRSSSAATACAPYRRSGRRRAACCTMAASASSEAWSNGASWRPLAVRRAGAIAHWVQVARYPNLGYAEGQGYGCWFARDPSSRMWVRAGRVKVFADRKEAARFFCGPIVAPTKCAHPEFLAEALAARMPSALLSRRVPICRLPGCECECSMMSMDAWWPIRAHLMGLDAFVDSAPSGGATSSSSRQRNVSHKSSRSDCARPCRSPSARLFGRTRAAPATRASATARRRWSIDRSAGDVKDQLGPQRQPRRPSHAARPPQGRGRRRRSRAAGVPRSRVWPPVREQDARARGLPRPRAVPHPLGGEEGQRRGDARAGAAAQ